MMKRSQIYLPMEQWRRLSALSSQVGEPVSELIRRAIDRVYKGGGQLDFKACVRQAAGLWKDRTNLGPTASYVRGLRRGARLRRLHSKGNA